MLPAQGVLEPHLEMASYGLRTQDNIQLEPWAGHVRTAKQVGDRWPPSMKQVSLSPQSTSSTLKIRNRSRWVVAVRRKPSLPQGPRQDQLTLLECPSPRLLALDFAFF